MTRLELELPASALRKLPTPTVGREAHSLLAPRLAPPWSRGRRDRAPWLPGQTVPRGGGQETSSAWTAVASVGCSGVRDLLSTGRARLPRREAADGRTEAGGGTLARARSRACLRLAG